MDLILPEDSIDKLEQILRKELLHNGADHVFLVDSSGNVVAESGNQPYELILPLAALSAANFSATRRMAQLLGQDEFTLLFHKGTVHNIHFFRMNEDFLLVTLFGNDVSLGLIRLGSNKAMKQILPIVTE